MTTPPRFGFTDEELRSLPTAFRADLFAGQVALVSGGGSGLGKAIAALLGRLGATIVICGRDTEKLQAACALFQSWGIAATPRTMTIRDAEQVAAAIGDVFEQHGRLDLLVNNAGGQFPQAAIDFTVKGWNAVIDTNLNGSWYMMQAAARQWSARKQPGSIVNIVANVWRGMPQVAHTCAARAGVIYLSKTLSTEWAPLNIRVNCISPGSISTEGLNVYPEEAADSFAKSNPMRSLGDVYDVAQGVVYLSADTAKFITGEVLVIDGGNNQWGDVWPGGKPDYFRVDET